MQLFQIKTQPNGIERKELFIREGFICIGYNNTKDLRGKDREEIKEILKEIYDWEGSRLGNHLGIVNAFVNTMQEGDHVIILDNDWVHIGEIGKYEYIEDYGKSINTQDICHIRKVKWLVCTEKYNLNEYVKELLRNRSIVTKFKHPYELANIEGLLEGKGVDQEHKEKIDGYLLQKSLDVLAKSLNSEDESLRIKSAIAILNYYK